MRTESEEGNGWLWTILGMLAFILLMAYLGCGL